MKILNILVLFALILTSQVYARPDKYDEGFVEDTPQDYDDDDDADAADKENKDTISGPPMILSKPMSYDIEAGKTVEFPCEIVNAENQATQWKKDDVLLFVGQIQMMKEKKHIRISQNNSLIITNVTKEDSSSNYVCEILTQPNPIKLVHKLVVDNDWSDRSIRPSPKKNIHINEGESVVFGCETGFKPSKEMKWAFKGSIPHFNEEINGNFITIKKATHKNHGHYQCLAEDEAGILHYESVDIFVSSVPVIEVPHEIIHTGIGMNSTLTCKVYGHPHVKVSWLKKDKEYINEEKNKYIIIDDKSHEHKLIIKNTLKDDLGNYTCIAKNIKGQVSADVVLSGSPATPKFISNKINDDDSTLTLKWHVESFSPITEYLLEYHEENKEEWKVEKPKVTNSMGNKYVAEFSLNNLPPNKYEAVLLAKNEFGWSERSSIHSFRKELSQEPQNVKGANSNASTTRPLLTIFTSLFLVVVTCVTIRL